MRHPAPRSILRAPPRVLALLAIAATSACAGLVTGETTGSAGAPSVDDPDARIEPSAPDADLFAASAPVFDESIVRRYDLILTGDALAELEDDPTDERYVHAVLRIDGERFPLAAVRYKGGSTLAACFDDEGDRLCEKVSLKLSFDEFDPEGSYRGLRKLNLHSMGRDPTMMHEAISYRIFRDAGIAAPRTAYARVTINGEDLGLHAVVENVDGRFTRSRFSDGGEGNLYEDVWPVHAGPEPYLAALRTNEDDDPNVDRMIDFASDLGAAGEAGFIEAAEHWKVFDPLMRYMAIARLLDHWDDITALYCGTTSCLGHNFYWYESTADDQFWFIPWDLDYTLGPNPHRLDRNPEWDQLDVDCAWAPPPVTWLLPASCDPVLRAMATVGRPRYVALTEELLDGAFAAEALDARIDELTALLADQVATDPNLQTVEDWKEAIDAMREHIAENRAFVAGRLR